MENSCRNSSYRISRIGKSDSTSGEVFNIHKSHMDVIAIAVMVAMSWTVDATHFRVAVL